MSAMKLELSHDILAKRIFDKTSAEDKMRLKIHHLLNDRLVYYQEQKALLSKDDLDYLAPFLGTIPIDAAHKELIEKSREAIRRRRIRYYIGIAMLVVWLGIFNIITNYSNASSVKDVQKQEETLKILNREDSLKMLADAHAESLLKFLQINNPQFTEQLIASYDTLKLVQQNLEKEKNIAQSSTLSNLANAALKQNNTVHAFQLAAKAWELNHSNKLACDVLYQVSVDSSYKIESDPVVPVFENDSLHNLYISRLISRERNEKGRGSLKEEELNKIFHVENQVIQKKDFDINSWYSGN